MKYFIFISFIISTFSSCAQTNNNEGGPFDVPKKKWFLPHKLEEVSGITWYGPNTLATVNDEKGKIYLYHLESEKIIKTIEFGKAGDYEGITYQKPFFYVVNSKGKLHIINEENLNVDKYQLPFTIDNDIEGLCLYEKTHLLIALKGKGGFNGKKEDYKGIYKINIEDPAQVELAYQLPKGDKVSPSGIFYDQKTNEILVLSHRSCELFYIDGKSGKISQRYPLKRSVFEQPEGICISPDGRLFISNEKGENLKANLLEF